MDEDAVKSWLAQFVAHDYLWIIEVFLVVTVTLIVAFVVSRALTKLVSRSVATKSLWDDALFESLLRPAKWMVWVLGLSYAAGIAAAQTEVSLLSMIAPARTVGSIVIIVWFVVGFIKRAERNLVDPEYSRKPMDQTTAMAIGKLLRVSTIITSALVMLQSLGYSISGVLAFGGIGGIAVGFAAKDLLANFFGGLMIYLDRPFAVGDWVRSPDKNIEGTVEDIGWRLTRIRTFDKRPLYVPNATFTQISVENPSRMLNRRIKETIGIRYDDADKMPVIVEDVKKMLRSHKDIAQDQTLIVNFNAFNACSLDFFIYTFTKTTAWVEFHEIKQDVMLKIINIIEGHGAECAFPTSTLHIPNGVTVNSMPDEASKGDAANGA
ncbi:mechanosensitive ion channel family protein [Marinagarivorans cellulosilyticus]|uniref:MscS family membrane protein n=1 Tax=Marinagarivorans cellulosilyticus TaxID=2721545 RepID=A0AAN2BLT6_9GAMM|nr:mechanosensitive ion channel family protein [Marinagarivorans cellulosilyticus]BCD99468.1 MscS family membrane protein [Marinagarivorans cellulosilyticus]